MTGCKWWCCGGIDGIVATTITPGTGAATVVRDISNGA